MDSLYDACIKSYENCSGGGILYRRCKDVDVTESKIEILKNSNGIVHTLISNYEKNEMIEIWAILVDNPSSSYTTQSEYALPVSMFSKYFHSTVQFMLRDDATENHIPASIHSVFTLQTIFDIFCSTSISPHFTHVQEFHSFQHFYIFCILCALGHKQNDERKNIRKTLLYFKTVVLKDIDINNAIALCVRLFDDHGAPDTLDHFCMYGLSTIITLCRHEAFAMGCMGESLETVYKQHFVQRCMLLETAVQGELLMMLYLGSNAGEKICGMSCYVSEHTQCIECKSRLHSMMVLIDLATPVRNGLICRKCKTCSRQNTCVTKATQTDTNNERIAFDLQECRESVKTLSREKKQLTKQLQRANEAVLSQQSQMRDCEANLALIKQELLEKKTVLCDIEIECKEANMRYEVMRTDNMTTKNMNDVLSQENIALKKQIDLHMKERVKHKSILSKCQDAADRELSSTIAVLHSVEIERDHLLSNNKSIEEMNQELKEQIVAFHEKETPQFATYKTIMCAEIASLEKAFRVSDIESIQRRADIWKERNAILTGEVKAAWRAYNILCEYLKY